MQPHENVSEAKFIGIWIQRGDEEPLYLRQFLQRLTTSATRKLSTIDELAPVIAKGETG